MFHAIVGDFAFWYPMVLLTFRAILAKWYLKDMK
jgi:hypothetical protein